MLGGTVFPPHIHMRLQVHTPLLWLCRLPGGAQAEGLAGAGEEACRGDEPGDSSQFLPKLLPGRTDPESESASGSPQEEGNPGERPAVPPPPPTAGARESPGSGTNAPPAPTPERRCPLPGRSAPTPAPQEAPFPPCRWPA